MKRIYTTLALVGAMVTGAFAQTDLQITSLEPVTNQHYANFVAGTAGDTMYVAAVLKNLGPDTLNASDTVNVSFPLDWIITQQGYAFTNSYRGDELNSRYPNGTDTVVFAFIQGSDIGATDDGSHAIINIPSNAVVNTIQFQAYGYDSTFTLLNDPGVDLDDNNNIVYSGNNLANPQGVTFGTVSVSTVNLTKTALTVYPNPTNSQINFAFNFATASANADLRITDISGRVVKSITLGKQNAGNRIFNVDVADLNNGMYFIELATDQNRGIAKFSKN